MKYILASHVFILEDGEEIYGSVHMIEDYLLSHSKFVLFIKHGLNKNSSRIKHGNQYNKIFSPKNFLLKSIWEVFFNLKTVLKMGGKEKIFYVGADPLNAFSGVLLRMLLFKFKFIYFTVDYSDYRFSNKYLNIIYKILDRICLIFCDEVWNVSSRICQKRVAQGVASRKIKLLPNSPSMKNVKLHNKKYDFINLVAITSLSDCFDLETIIKVFKGVHKKNSSIRLYVIGDGPEKDRFIKMVEKEGLAKKIIFLGYLEYKEALKFLAKCFVGFALYTQKNDFNRYGDSTKAREYAAYGLPTIINEIPSNSDDISRYNMGIVVSENSNQEVPKMIKYINNLVESKSLYDEIRANCIKYSIENDKEKILKALFSF